MYDIYNWPTSTRHAEFELVAIRTMNRHRFLLEDLMTLVAKLRIDIIK